MTSNNFHELSLLSKTELEWLLGNIELSGSDLRKIKSKIKKRLENFEKFELPLLVEKRLISLSGVTKFGIVLLNTVTLKVILPGQTMKTPKYVHI